MHALERDRRHVRPEAMRRSNTGPLLTEPCLAVIREEPPPPPSVRMACAEEFVAIQTYIPGGRHAGNTDYATELKKWKILLLRITGGTRIVLIIDEGINSNLMAAGDIDGDLLHHKQDSLDYLPMVAWRP